MNEDMEKYNDNIAGEKSIRDLLSGTKLTANENLQYRIMQQIKTEKSLTQKEQKRGYNIIFSNMLPIFAVLYGIMAGLAIKLYSESGLNALKTEQFFIPVLFVSIICSAYWLISVVDEKRNKY